MSDLSSRPLRLQSWIPPSFAWTTAPDVFCIDVPASDPDLVEFLATGELEIEVFCPRRKARQIALLWRVEKSLLRQLLEAVWEPAKLKPTDARIEVGTKVVAYCHGVFLLPDGKNLCVAVGRSKPDYPDAWIPAGLNEKANALLKTHQSKVAKDNEASFDSNIDLNKSERCARAAAVLAMVGRCFPVLTAEQLLDSLPYAAKFPKPTSADPEKIARAAVTAIAASGWPPPRDGNFAGILHGASRRRTHGFVSWVPHRGLPSYPEVRWAVQKRLPAALRKPRTAQMGKPKFDTGFQPVEDSVQVQGFDPTSNDLKDALDELTLDDGDFSNRVDDVRKEAKEHGFEAIAWFQPYHVWTEETWGIYFDARKLDDLALSFLDYFMSMGVHASHSLAALLAFGLTYAHELFHARVEAALSWTEINAQQPRYLRYKERVYQALRETPDWLEEALANWSAWNWFKAPGVQSLVARMVSNAECLNRVVEASLDLAPPGYQEWWLGHQPGTWRTFANQLSTGNPKINATGIGLPLESALTGPLPYDFQPADIPLRFVGSGVIADRLQSHPATFNVPSHRELERALKYFGYSLDASGGKGSHQKWTRPKQRAFILPTRDPVSIGVFKTFLYHMGIDKDTYVRQVRPNL